MTQLDEHSKKMIREYPIAMLLSFFFVIFGLIFLKLYLDAQEENYLVGAISGLSLGLISTILNTGLFLKNLKKNKQIKKALEYGSSFKASINGEKSDGIEGKRMICTAEINGTKYEFISEPVSRYASFACKELGIDTLTVYVNTSNPKEYVVDIREIEDRIVDLTK